MLPLRLVLDTNIVVSAALKPDGLQGAVLLLAITKPARFNVSTHILAGRTPSCLVPPAHCVSRK